MKTPDAPLAFSSHALKPTTYSAKSIRISGLSLAVVGLLAATSAFAQTNGVWEENASGIWSDPANWVGGNIADGAGSTADFSLVDITGARTVTIDGLVASRTVGTLLAGDTTANGFGYTFAGSNTPTLTFNNNGSGAVISQVGVAVTGANPPPAIAFASTIGVVLADNLTVNNTQQVTISSVISETGGARNITKIGSGTLSLGGTNTFTGTLSVHEGTLSYSSNAQLGQGAGPILIGNTNGSANATLANSATADSTVSRGIRAQGGNTGTSSVRISGNGTLTNTYTGGIVLGTDGGSGHGLTLHAGTSFGTLHVTTLAITNPTGMTAGTAGALTIAGGADSRVRLSTANSYTGGTIISSGRLQLNNAGALGSGTLTINGGGFVQGFGSYTSNTNNAMVWNGNFTAEGSLTTDMGTGAVNLGATGTDTTRTINSSNTGTTGNTGFVVRGVISDGTNGFTTNLTKSGTGILTLGGANTYSGNTTITAGTLRMITNNNRLPTTTTLDIGASGTFDMNQRSQSVAGLTGTGTVQNSAATTTSTVTVTGTSTFGGVIRNNGGTGGTVALTKSTGGTLTLTGANTYTGATNVTAGALIIGAGGSLGNTAVTVAAGAAFGGTGTLGGSLNVSGDVSPGNSPGTLNTGALTLQSTANLSFELDGLAETNDLLNVTGNLILNGTLNVANLGDLQTGSYTLINYTGTLTDNGLDFGSMASGFNYSLNTGTANQIILNVTAVPEPTTTVLLTLGLTALAVRRKGRSASPL